MSPEDVDVLIIYDPDTESFVKGFEYKYNYYKFATEPDWPEKDLYNDPATGHPYTNKYYSLGTLLYKYGNCFDTFKYMIEGIDELSIGLHEVTNSMSSIILNEITRYNSSDISGLKKTVSSNTSNIATNTSDISGLKSSVSANTSNIAAIEGALRQP